MDKIILEGTKNNVCKSDLCYSGIYFLGLSFEQMSFSPINSKVAFYEQEVGGLHINSSKYEP